MERRIFKTLKISFENKKIKTGIYLIENTINNKKYIGQSKNIYKRWNEHLQNYKKSDKNQAIYKAMRKYGADNFKFKIIELCPQEKLNEMEMKWISFFDAYANGYNQTKGGASSYNSKISEKEVKEIIDLLKNTKKSIISIASIYEINPNIVSSINVGTTWIQNEITYPIRKLERPTLSDSDFEEIVFKLKNTELSNLEIAKIYNVSENTICAINTGKSRKKDYINYPIRETRQNLIMQKNNNCIIEVTV